MIFITQSTMSAPSRKQSDALPPPVRVSHNYDTDDDVIKPPLLPKPQHFRQTPSRADVTPSRMPVRSTSGQEDTRVHKGRRRR
jgi:hypothetical protein